MTRVKVCGTTRMEDGQLAAHLGADAIGFVLCDSPRRVDVETARTIALALPPYVERVGVFRHQTKAEVMSIAARVGLTRVQLHGDESPETFADLPWPLTRALTLTDVDLADSVTRWRAARFDVQFLFDLPKRLDVSGGDPTDPREVWSACVVPKTGGGSTIAGGLTPENVPDVITTLAPAAVDVARGVEASPGVKDPARMRAFFAAVRRADFPRSQP